MAHNLQTIFSYIFFKEYFFTLIQSLQKFVPQGPIDYKTALV